MVTLVALHGFVANLIERVSLICYSKRVICSWRWNLFSFFSFSLSLFPPFLVLLSFYSLLQQLLLLFFSLALGLFPYSFWITAIRFSDRPLFVSPANVLSSLYFSFSISLSFSFFLSLSLSPFTLIRPDCRRILALRRLCLSDFINQNSDHNPDYWSVY